MPGTGGIIRQAVSAGLRSRHFYQLYILGLLLIYCALLYYFGEIANLCDLDVAGTEFFCGAHDVHRLFFLVPVIYAGCTFGIRAALIITMVAAVIFLPRTLFAPAESDELLRAIIFIPVTGAIGYFATVTWRKFRKGRAS